MNLSAGNLLSVSGANVGTSPNGKVTLQAADIALGTVTTSSSQNSVWDENNYSKYSSSTEVGSTISGGSVAISASNDLALRATTINAAPTGQVSLSAGHSVSIEAGSSSSNYDGKSQSGSNGLFSFQDKAQTSIQDQGIVRSTVNGGSVVISSGQGTGVGDITLSGLTVNAKALTLNAADGNGTLNLNVAQTQHDESRTSASNSALWQSQGGKGSSSTDAQYNQFNLGANQPVITKGAGTALAGTAGATSAKSDTTVAMLSPTAGVGSASTALVDSTALATSPSNTGVAGLTINAAKVNVQVGVTSHKTTDGEDSTFTKGTLQSSIQQLASQPGTAYIATLQSQLQSNPAFKNPDGTSKVNWQQIDQAHQNWNYESQGLTAAGAAVVALIVAACTAGAGIAALGPMTAGAMGFTTTVVEGVLVTSTAASMVSAAVIAGAGSLITQASISLINNQGDLGKTFQDLGSSQSLKQLAMAMVTAGALQGLGSVPLGESGFTLNSINANSSFVSQLGKNLVNNTAGAMISTAINGGKLETALKNAVISAGLDTTAAVAASQVPGLTSALTDSTTLNAFASEFAHSLIGCGVGAARAGAVGNGNAGAGCGAGAIGAVVAHSISNTFPDATTTEQRTEQLALSRLFGGLAATIAGGDAQAINIAASAASNAVENNRQMTPKQVNAIKAIAGSDAEKEYRLMAAGCAIRHCADGIDPSAPAYAVLKRLQDNGSSMTAELEQLMKLQAPTDGRTQYLPVFQKYDLVDTVVDGATKNNTVSRGLQVAGGVVEAGAGVAACTTAWGCVGGALLFMQGTDYVASAIDNKAPLGEQVLQAMGMNPKAAAVGYAMLGVAPAVIQGVVATRAINAEIAANAWSRGTYTGQSATSFEGRVYRFSDPAYASTTWEIYPGNAISDFRYSGSGVGSVYSGTSVGTAAAEVRSYSLTTFQPKTLVAGDVRISGVLDLTNPAALKALGVTREEITLSSHGANGAYTQTQRIAEWAREQGYNAILAPSAQNRVGTNLITFENTQVTNVRLSPPLINVTPPSWK